ncbi:hypothetical protein B7494_g3122, partial [Chlorociboria aeruginascens]
MTSRVDSVVCYEFLLLEIDSTSHPSLIPIAATNETPGLQDEDNSQRGTETVNKYSNLSSNGSSTSITNNPSWKSAPDYAAPTPFYSLTKSSSRLALAKVLTFRSEAGKERRRERKRQKEMDAEPRLKYPGDGSVEHQDLLRAFEFRFHDEGVGDGEGYE